MKHLHKFIAVALCCIVFINNSNIAYAEDAYPAESVETDDNIQTVDDIQIYKVPIISNQAAGSTITFYGCNGKFYLAIDDIKDFTRYKLNESDSQLILSQGIREIRIEKDTGHMIDCNCIEQGVIDIIKYNGKYLCEGIPMLTYLGALCTIKDGTTLQILMPPFTIWETMMLDYRETITPDYLKYIELLIKELSEYHFSDLSDDLLIPEWMQFFECHPLSEEELIAKTQAVAGYPLKDYAYVDMDHDGLNELIGVADIGDDAAYPIWYCSSDGNTCLLIEQFPISIEAINIELLEFNNETHVVVNGYRLLGNYKYFSIISLKNGEPCLKAANEYGSVYMTESGDIILDVEGYDGIYDPDTDSLSSHTWVDTYLCYDGESYKEYIAYEITEDEYSEFTNAQEIKDRIAEKLTESDTAELEYRYFKRKNNILHIQCNIHQNSGMIYYGYYTLRYFDDVLDEQFIIPDNQTDEYNPGQMYPRLSDFEAVQSHFQANL